MHSFFRSLHGSSGDAQTMATNGLVLNGGWRYDLEEWVHDLFSRGRAFRAFRQRTIHLAALQPGEAVLDVGCGTGTLALEAAGCVGSTGHVSGIDPSPQQLARALPSAARRDLSLDFQLGVIERLPSPDRTFDVVLSSLMMHHLPAPVKRQGLVQIARVLKPGGRLIIADFTHKQDRKARAARFHAGGSRLHDLVALVEEAGFVRVEHEEMQSSRFSAFPGAGFVRAYKGEASL
jgi:ubiquinone/menaquinone biosynthesis C-methylase UbiE